MRVAIITEGFQGTGYGHLTRCLSIYQAFEEKGMSPLYIANCDETGKKFIPDVNLLQLNWIEKEDALLSKIKNYDIAIIDSYLAPLETYNKIFKSVKKTVYIDDYIRLNYPPGIIVNGTIGAENLPYPKSEKHKLLLGIDFMPLRKEFWDVEIPERNNNAIKNVLITFGAQDFRNLTAKVLAFLFSEFPNMNYHVVVSEKFVPELENDNIHYYNSLNAKEMLNLMLKADIAITAAGQTTYELARIGLPTIAIGVIENQKFNIEGWLKKGFINAAIWYDDNNLFIKIKNFINIPINRKLDYNNLYNGFGARNIIENLTNIINE